MVLDRHPGKGSRVAAWFHMNFCDFFGALNLNLKCFAFQHSQWIRIVARFCSIEAQKMRRPWPGVWVSGLTWKPYLYGFMFRLGTNMHLCVTFIKLHCIYFKFESCNRTVYFHATERPYVCGRLLVLYVIAIIIPPAGCTHSFPFRLHSRHECQTRNYHRHHLNIIYFHHLVTQHPNTLDLAHEQQTRAKSANRNNELIRVSSISVFFCTFFFSVIFA